MSWLKPQGVQGAHLSVKGIKSPGLDYGYRVRLGIRVERLAKLEPDPDLAAKKAGLSLMRIGAILDPPTNVAELVIALEEDSRLIEYLKARGMRLPLTLIKEEYPKEELLMTLENWVESLKAN